MTTTTAVQQPLKQAPAPSKMTLAAVKKGKLEVPYKIFLYGVDGVGKSTFGSQAPSPIFLGAEEGTAYLDVARFPRPETFADVLEAIAVLGRDAHEHQTLVIDTLDWVEPMIWREVIASDKDATTIQEVSGGYGKGFDAAMDYWRKLVAYLERLQAAKRMHVILLAHSLIKSFKNPEGPDYDRYQVALQDKAAGLFRQWADDVLFAKPETLAHKEKGRVRGVSTGARILYAERTAALDAKNRHGLPSELPFSWADFEAAVKGVATATAELKAEIVRKAKELGIEDKVLAETVAKAKEDPRALEQINNRLNVRIAEKATAQTAAPSAEKAS